MPGNHATGTQGITASSELNRDIAGVQGTYGWSVQSGAVTFTSGLQFAVAAIAAGDYTVNSVSGSLYAGGNITLSTQDPTNPRVDIIVITSAGAVSAVAGTPAALTTSSGPVPPTPSSSQLEIARIYVPATGTSLSSASITDRRHPMVASVIALAGSANSAVSTTSTSAVDVVTISGLSIAVGTPYRVEANYRKQALAANGCAAGWKENTTVVYEAAYAASTAPMARTSASNQAESGGFVIHAFPRSASTYNGFYVTCGGVIRSDGVASVAPYLAAGPPGTTLRPNATTTVCAIRGINDSVSNALEFFSVRVLTGID